MVQDQITGHLSFDCVEREKVLKILSDYCENTTIHGVKYFGGTKRTKIERFLWAVVLIFSLSICSFLIYKIWKKWEETPVLLSLSKSPTHVWEIPFPAITICAQSKSRTNVFNFTDIYQKIEKFDLAKNITEENLKIYEVFSQFCNPWLFTPNKTMTINQALDGQVIKKLKSISMRFGETFVKCDFGDEIDKGCGKLFREILTDDGVCYTFNAIQANELFRMENIHKDYNYSMVNFQTVNWTVDNGYELKAGAKTYPHRVLGSGERAGFNIVLKMDKRNFDYVCKGPVQGYKILLHNPAEFPQPSKHYFRIPVKREVIVSVMPQLIKTSDDLLNYSPESRQCYFSQEKYLKYFKIYTQKNCEIECLANYTLNKCGCVKFNMVRGSDTRICSFLDASCYFSTDYDLLESNLESGDTCNCLPECTSIQFNTEVSSAKFDVEKEKLARGKYSENMSNYQYSKVTIFFKNSQFISSKRSELYGLTDFIANCGGILGLFMGISLVSIVEILYYCTVRPLNALRRKRAEATNKLTLKISKISS